MSTRNAVTLVLFAFADIVVCAFTAISVFFLYKHTGAYGIASFLAGVTMTLATILLIVRLREKKQ
jgi:hypothetical protein